jgi:hypothetical protein
LKRALTIEEGAAAYANGVTAVLEVVYPESKATLIEHAMQYFLDGGLAGRTVPE